MTQNEHHIDVSNAALVNLKKFNIRLVIINHLLPIQDKGATIEGVEVLN